MKTDFCTITNESSGSFVGIQFVEGKPTVIFPRGYRIPKDEKELRRAIFRLLNVIQKFSSKMEGDKDIFSDEKVLSDIPLKSYQYIILDFLSNGYYTENEVLYTDGTKGKISWKRTIQQKRPQLDNGNVVYLDFKVKTNRINSDSIITSIHKYCVYQSFYRFGWLYLDNEYLPQEPKSKPDIKYYVTILRQELNRTFNDEKRRLFLSMISILSENQCFLDNRNISIGVNRFEYVWEKLVDFVFGEDNKDEYFPHANWYIEKNGSFKQSSALEPDTIMIHAEKTYVLDSKYYRYGITYDEKHLPNSSSIQKQITYGKHIVESMHRQQDEVYNAFIMPYQSDSNDIMKFVSVGTAGWDEYTEQTPNYNYVLGILLDTEYLISNYSKHNAQDIEMLSDLIEKSLEKFKKAQYGSEQQTE